MYQRHGLALKLLHPMCTTHLDVFPTTPSGAPLNVQEVDQRQLHMYLQGWCHGLRTNVQLEQGLLVVMTSAFQAPR